MKAKVKKMVDASVTIQNIIIDAAKRTGKLSKEQVDRICDLFDGETKQVKSLIRDLVENNENLTKGSGCLAATFDPIDAVEACESELDENDYNSLLTYAESVRVAYWNF